MYIARTLIILIFLFQGFVVNGQAIQRTKYLSIGTRGTGICFGNSVKYNGIRFNFFDREMETEHINGINMALISTSHITNGIQAAGLAVRSEHINGVSVSGIWLAANKINGAGVSFGVVCDTLNGVFAGFAVAPTNNREGTIINGAGFGMLTVGAEKIRGLTVAGFICNSNEHYGVSVAALNKSEKLHGLQIGLLNYAGNNPKLLRWMPIVNFHL